MTEIERLWAEGPSDEIAQRAVDLKKRIVEHSICVSCGSKFVRSENDGCARCPRCGESVCGDDLD